MNERSIVFCGGPLDGRRDNVTHAANYVRAVASAVGFENFTKDTEVLYTARKYVSSWPIANWGFEIFCDATVDAEGNEGEAYEPWWTARVYATRERHSQIEEHITSQLSPAINEILLKLEDGIYLEMHEYIRADAMGYDLGRVDAQLVKLYELTHNPILESS